MISLPYADTIKSINPRSLDQCKTILVDNLQECFYRGLEGLHPWADKVVLLTGGKHKTNHSWQNVINIPEWFWYYESRWYTTVGYDSYRPQPSSDRKLFLMPIRRIKLGRDLIYNKLKNDLLTDAVWSYVERGKELPGMPDYAKEDQRWFNPEWYNTTEFSVVNEDSDDSQPLIWTEKTCKPLAFYHPFILVAQQGVLDLVKQAGFETFPELFDESYDDIPSIYNRVNFIDQQIRNFDRSKLNLPSVKEKLEYNHNRFFDSSLVDSQIIDKLINPLLGFIDI